MSQDKIKYKVHKYNNGGLSNPEYLDLSAIEDCKKKHLSELEGVIEKDQSIFYRGKEKFPCVDAWIFNKVAFQITINPKHKFSPDEKNTMETGENKTWKTINILNKLGIKDLENFIWVVPSEDIACQLLKKNKDTRALIISFKLSVAAMAKSKQLKKDAEKDTSEAKKMKKDAKQETAEAMKMKAEAKEKTSKANEMEKDAKQETAEAMQMKAEAKQETAVAKKKTSRAEKKEKYAKQEMAEAMQMKAVLKKKTSTAKKMMKKAKKLFKEAKKMTTQTSHND